MDWQNSFFYNKNRMETEARVKLNQFVGQFQYNTYLYIGITIHIYQRTRL